MPVRDLCGSTHSEVLCTVMVLALAEHGERQRLCADVFARTQRDYSDAANIPSMYGRANSDKTNTGVLLSVD